MGAKAFPLVLLGIGFTSCRATLITQLMCPKVGGYTGGEERVLEEKQIKIQNVKVLL